MIKLDQLVFSSTNVTSTICDSLLSRGWRYGHTDTGDELRHYLVKEFEYCRLVCILEHSETDDRHVAMVYVIRQPGQEIHRECLMEVFDEIGYTA